ncbi:methyltransferase [Metarhizium robertsii]|uniref:UbiE/COQ5 family methyltransferase n=2 Tax=Metarhizium robertsii TaxID=568076 RepID=E9EQK0_METRA|nr:UbiE/COQ5 family methyltransferase [Metarhizium robertsii ARSEF 23]EFZ02559.1 UbiE/COQ5 family methyltransferase [Metarhizium robertsii ARSEF 23]EXV05763.1 methyltransferase [Metarhizium robertsii]
MSQGDKSFWDRSAAAYSQAKVSDERGYQRTLAATRSYLGRGDRVLELGCGTGSAAFVLAPCVASYLATDLSSEMIRIANEKRGSNPDVAPGLAFRAATAEDVARSSRARFDAVLAYNYLHLVRDPWATVAAIRDVLGDGGVFVSKTACVGGANPLMRWVVLPAMQAVGRAPHVNKFTGAELKRRIREAGFEILAEEVHSSKGDDGRLFIVARRK